MKIFLAALLLSFSITSAYAQIDFRFGPGSFWDHDEREHHGYDHDRYCRHLREACIHKHELGEEGEGNCQRYRDECK